MANQAESFAVARQHLDQARTLVDQLAGTASIVGEPAAPGEPSSWEWLRDQLRGLADRLRGMVSPSPADAEIRRRAWEHLKASAEQAARTTTGVLRGDFGAIASVAGKALEVVDEAFGLHLRQWAMLAALWFIWRGVSDKR